MNGLKIGIILFGIIFLATGVFAVMLQLDNMKLNEEVHNAHTEIDITKLQIQQYKQKLNMSQLFITTQMKAKGVSAFAWDEDNRSLSFYKLANSYYVNNSWDNAILYYTKAKNSYQNASQKWMNTALLYQKIETYTTNTTYQKYYHLYYQAYLAYSNSTAYSANDVDYMSIACQYYKNGNYTSADSNYNKSEVAFNRSMEEEEKGASYLYQAEILIKELYIN